MIVLYANYSFVLYCILSDNLWFNFIAVKVVLYSQKEKGDTSNYSTSGGLSNIVLTVD